ncbi:MAG: hypothetical protein CMJ58_18910 [Planctomycetaceae bacterium]|nr:hypothetical protein [Planctomycetaceae bacterium]
MVQITFTVPEAVRDLAVNAARERGVSLDEFLCKCVATSVGYDRASDPLFAGLQVWEGDAPSDLSENHDDYLYGDKEL